MSLGKLIKTVLQDPKVREREEREREAFRKTKSVDEVKLAWSGSPRPWRVGTKALRTIYDANNELIGLMDHPEDAALVVACANAKHYGR
jgi:hypothetical protein